MAGDWTEDSRFDEIALTDSWLVGFSAGPKHSFYLHAELRLGADHPDHFPPHGEEVDCFRSGRIVAEECLSVTFKGGASRLPRDSDGFDFGEIESCKLTGSGIFLKTETIEFNIECGSISIELDKE